MSSLGIPFLPFAGVGFTSLLLRLLTLDFLAVLSLENDELIAFKPY